MGQIQRIYLTCFTLSILAVQTAWSYGIHHEEPELSYRLPDALYPEYYRLEILTNLADLDNNYTFAGRVWIQVKCKKPTNKIILHAKNLIIEEDEVTVTFQNEDTPVTNANTQEKDTPYLDKDNINIKILNHCYHDDYDFYMLTLAEELQIDAMYVIYIPFEGKLTQTLAGYYRSSYKDLATGETRWLAVTQFESTDARRALPCFDEPSFKAKFQVNLGHASHRTSISNMRIISTTPIENMNNWVWDEYEVTVPMSTYLLAFIVSDFQHKVSPTLSSNDVLFRVWARNDAINQVDFASLVGPRVLEYFEVYFDVKYPLPKMDMVAIPDFSSGAMENWGLITYREVALLYDPAVSTAFSQPYVASVVSHEIAHQWFGNLVTMKWWTDLWLNEGFATYVAALGVHFIHPEWKFLEEEVVDNMMSVFSLDSLKSSHPISVPIGHPREIAQIFDTISYQKGSFVLRMMNLFLGEEVFRSGVSNYLKSHAFGNAEQDDLWNCLTAEAHKHSALPDCMTVKRIMDSWTLQTGYPLISVVRNYESGSAVVYQERFLGDRTDYAEGRKDMPPPTALKTKWWVPLSYTWESEGDFNNTRPKQWLSIKQTSLVIEGLPSNEWVIFNIQISGLYRVKYDEENWGRIISTLMTNHQKIGMLNRVQLIEDSLELAKTGDIPYTIPFNILKYLQKEYEYLPWKAALKNLGFVDKMLRFYPTYGYFRSFIKELITNLYEKLSKENQSNIEEDLSKVKHQTLISSNACKFEVGNCKEKAVEMFRQWMLSNEEEIVLDFDLDSESVADPYPDPESDRESQSEPQKNSEKIIPKEARSYVYCTAIRYGGEKEWDFLWKKYKTSNVGNERSLILNALCCTREIWLLNRYLQWSIDENSGIRKQDSSTVFGGVARGDIGYFLAKSFFKTHLNDIYEFYGPRASKLGMYVSVLATQITSETELIELTQFTEKNMKYFEHSQQALRQALENSKINIQWQRKFYHELSSYLQTQATEHKNPFLN